MMTGAATRNRPDVPLAEAALYWPKPGRIEERPGARVFNPQRVRPSECMGIAHVSGLFGAADCKAALRAILESALGRSSLGKKIIALCLCAWQIIRVVRRTPASPAPNQVVLSGRI